MSGIQLQVDPFLAAQQLEPQPKGYGVYKERKTRAGRLYKGMEYMTGIGRLLFCNLTNPKGYTDEETGEEGNPKLGIAFGFCDALAHDPSGQSLGIQDAVYQVADKAYPNVESVDVATGSIVRRTGSYFVRNKTYRNPVRPGNELVEKDHVKYADYFGLWFCNASFYPVDTQGSPNILSLRDQNNQPCAAGLFYSGCYARVMLNIKQYHNPKGGHGITMYFTGLQFCPNGPRIVNSDNTDYMASGTFDREAKATDAFAAGGPLVGPANPAQPRQVQLAQAPTPQTPAGGFPPGGPQVQL
jgi:hypothetical protein